jgi:hypothetical protein
MRKDNFFLKWDNEKEFLYFLMTYLLLTISFVSFIDMGYADGKEDTSPIEPVFKELTTNATRLSLDKKMNGSVHINEGSAEIDAFLFILPEDNFFIRYEMWLYIERTSKENGSIFVYCIDEQKNHIEEDNVINGTYGKQLGFFRDKIESKKIFIFIQGEGNYTVGMYFKTHPPATLIISCLFLILLILISWVVLFILGVIFITSIEYRNIKNNDDNASRTTIRTKKDYHRYILGRKKFLRKKRFILIFHWILIILMFLMIGFFINFDIIPDEFLWLKYFY